MRNIFFVGTVIHNGGSLPGRRFCKEVKMNKRRMLVYSFIFFMVAILVTPGIWAVMLPLSTGELVNGSDVVLIGEVIEVKSAWSADRSIIFSRADVRVYRVINGTYENPSVWVEYQGGQVGEIKMGVSDQPGLIAGERVLLFLAAGKTYGARREQLSGGYNNVYNIFGGGQGIYRIDGDEVASKGGFSVIPSPGSLQSMEAIIDNRLPVDLLVDKIRGKDVSLPVERCTPASSAQGPVSTPSYSYSAKWGVSDVWLQINPSGGPSFGVNGVIAAMKEWSDVDNTTFRWRYAGATTSKSTSKNGYNIVYFTTNLGGGYLGYSNWWSLGGKIVETDVRLRSNYNWSYAVLKALALHELGHSLGLNHVSSRSIMISYVPYRELQQDDKNAVKAMYPGGKVVTKLNDFNGDGKDDLLWHYESSGQIYMWLLNGITPWATLVSGGKEGSIIDAMSGYILLGIADFDGDDNDDLLWQHGTTGQVYIWLLDGVTPYSTLQSGGKEGALISALSNYKLIGIGDFDGDGKSDLLWRNISSGQVYVWLLDGVTPWSTLQSGGREGALVDSLSSSWILNGIGDFDGDGKDDLLWRDKSSGQPYVWLLNGVTPWATLQSGGKEGGLLDSLSSDWVLKGVSDFNGDGKDDLLWQTKSTGQPYIWLLDGITPWSTLQSGGKEGPLLSSLSGYKLIGIGDFDADGNSDLVWGHISSDEIYVWLLDGITPWATLQSGGKEGALISSLASWRLERNHFMEGN